MREAFPAATIDPEAFNFNLNVSSPSQRTLPGPRNASEMVKARRTTRQRWPLNLQGVRTITVPFAATVGGYANVLGPGAPKFTPLASTPRNLDWSRLLVRNPVPASSSFLVYASSHCVPEREQTYSKLVDMAAASGVEMPTAIGACAGGHPNTRKVQRDQSVRSHWEQWRGTCDRFSKFKFVLCMESSNVLHYMTEKMLVAFASGAVPVYWGSGGTVFEIFDDRTFLYINPSGSHDVPPTVVHCCSAW